MKLQIPISEAVDLIKQKSGKGPSLDMSARM